VRERGRTTGRQALGQSEFALWGRKTHQTAKSISAGRPFISEFCLLNVPAERCF
jgi:hypothetical protein